MLLLKPEPPVTLAGSNSLVPADFQFVCEDGPAAEWHVRRFELFENVSELYRLSIDLLTADIGVDVKELLGTRCTLEISRGIDGRLVHGVIREVRALGLFSGRLRVHVEVAPALALLAQQTDTRFWQDRSVPQILREVLLSPLRELGCAVEFRTEEAAHAPREYCVQFRESDLDFAARLMHEEGFSYFFKHKQGDDAETLVIVDSTTRADDLDHALPAVPFVARASGAAPSQSLASFDWYSRLETTAVDQRDWDWQDAGAGPYQHAHGTHDAHGRVRTVHLHDQRRLHRDDGSARARRDLEVCAAQSERGTGESDVIEMLPGHVVALRGPPGMCLDGDYLLVRVTHRGDAPDREQFRPGGAKSPQYSNTFECIRAATPYRLPVAPKRPRVHGPHTAIVVGPPREEIHTDEHGRIKVRFHWDRRSPADDTASCWLRVAQASAGAGWGSLFLPRVGMEVLVEFIDGDPDRPLITGCVYNSINHPPLPLPDQKTQSTLKSESTPGGGGFNQLRFEDASGSEELYIHAQRDLNEVVLHDNTRSVGHDQRFKISSDQSVSIGGNQSIDVTGDRSLTVSEGDERTTIAAGTSTTTVHGDRTVRVEQGDSILQVQAGAHSAKILGDVTIESLEGGVAVTGSAAVSLESTTSSVSLTAQSFASLTATTGMLTLEGQTDVGLASKTTRLALSAPEEVNVSSSQRVAVTGGTLDLNATERIVLSVGTSSITIEPGGITISSPKISSAAVGIHEIRGALIKIH